MWIEERHNDSARDLKSAETFFLGRFFAELAAGPAAFVTWASLIAGLTLKENDTCGKGAEHDIFRLADGLSTRAGQAAVLMLYVVVLCLAIWERATRNYYHACPHHKTVPKAKSVQAILSIVAVLFVGGSLLVCDPRW